MEKILNKCCVSPPVNVVAVNDPYMTANHMAYLFKYDSVHGIYPGDITTMGSCIIIDGQRIECTRESEPEKIPWSKNCTEYVIESSGMFLTCAAASKHNARRVIITADSPDAPIFVMGVNHDCYENNMRVVSGGSGTTVALAPLLKVVHENFAIEHCIAYVVHAAMGCQLIVDGYRKKWKLGRTGMLNMVPMSASASEGIQRVYPELQGKIAVSAIRVPALGSCMLTLTASLGQECPVDMMKCKIKGAANSYLKGILGYTEEELVSTDYIGDNRSCVFDLSCSVPLSRCFVQFNAWFDNEFGYACRIVDLANYIDRKSVV